MNRKATILAAACTLLAVFAATIAGVGAGHKAASASAVRPSGMSGPVPAPIFLKSKLTTMLPQGASPPSAASTSGASARGQSQQQSRQQSQPQASDDSTPSQVLRFASNPEPLPLFMAQDITGNMISTAAYKGKVVFVNFWATWCPPCREEIPDLIKLQQNYKDQFQIISISEDDATPEAMREFARQAQINYPIVLMTNEINRDFGGVPALPTSFVTNKEGGIVQKHVGLYSPELFEAEIRTLAGMPGALTVETFKDEGEIFLKNAANATDLPGVDFSGLTADQKQVALRRMNAESCTCGCKLTLAQCRINDTSCGISLDICAKMIATLSGDPPKKKAGNSETRKPAAAASGTSD